MDVAFAFDEAYVNPAQVAIESVLDCHRHRDDVTIWVLTTGAIAAKRANALQQQVAGRGQLKLLTIGEEFRALPVSQRKQLSYISAATHLRLMLPGLVPASLDRLLYLDSDVIVTSELTPLWELPLGDAPFAAVQDAFTPTVGDRNGIPGGGPDMDGTAPYFNAGVLLMHLPRWRKLQMTEGCLRYLSENAGRLRFPGQDALNVIGYGTWLQLPRAWNTMLFLAQPGLDAVPDTEVRVVHFIGAQKPWTEGTRPCSGKALWDRYAVRASPFLPVEPVRER